jgi:hypothetical protein
MSQVCAPFADFLIQQLGCSVEGHSCSSLCYVLNCRIELHLVCSHHLLPKFMLCVFLHRNCYWHQSEINCFDQVPLFCLIEYSCCRYQATLLLYKICFNSYVSLGIREVRYVLMLEVSLCARDLLTELLRQSQKSGSSISQKLEAIRKRSK